MRIPTPPNSLIWWLFTTVMGVLLLAAGAWASEQMKVDKELRDALLDNTKRVSVTELHYAVMEERWKSVDEKLERLLSKEPPCNGRR